MKSKKEPDKFSIKDYFLLIAFLSGILILIIFYIYLDVWTARLPITSRGDEFPCSGLTIIFIVILIVITIGFVIKKLISIYYKPRKKRR